jgi:2,4-dienoyl-CoA reductase-like NADH-dependent reductase (Old Yellow Enzyme family)
MSTGAAGRSPLFTPIELHGVRSRNRVVVSPMCLYTAKDGFASAWHRALPQPRGPWSGIVFVEVP